MNPTVPFTVFAVQGCGQLPVLAHQDAHLSHVPRRFTKRRDVLSQAAVLRVQGQGCPALVIPQGSRARPTYLIVLPSLGGTVEALNAARRMAL